MLINNIDELKIIIGGTPRNNAFENIAPAIEDAKNFIIPFIGQEAYDIANAIADDSYDGELSVYWQLKFLLAAQKPIAWKAQHDYVPEGNVIFDDTGIHTQKSNDGQTAAWQWQVEDLQRLYLKKAYNTLNELLVFLDTNRDEYPFWQNSEAERWRQKLFVRTPAEFGQFFDIKGSFALLLTIMPDMLSVQRNTIRHALGNELYVSICEKWRTKTDFSEHEKAAFELCQVIASCYGLARRVRTLPVSLMPDGMVEYYHSDRTNIKASNNVRLELIDQIAKQLESDGAAAMNELNDLLADDSENPGGSFYAQSKKGFMI